MRIRKYYVLLLIFAAVVAPRISLAAEIFFTPSRGEAREDELIKMNVYVAPAGERINAVGGKLTFPNELLTVADINFGNSFLNFWPERPHSEKGGLIVFSGVVPGGFESLGKGLLFSVVFRARKEGRAMLRMTDASVLKDDGAGTAADLTLKQGSIAITKKELGGEATSSRELSLALDPKSDTEPPESFVPLIGASPDLFGGKHFLVFATTDKQSGIDHYEVEESANQMSDSAKWIRAESPYELSDRAMQGLIFIKAVDKAGNMRIATVLPKHPLPFYHSLLFWSILGMAFVILLVFGLVKKMRKKPRAP